jgi:hypothetical protein
MPSYPAAGSGVDARAETSEGKGGLVCRCADKQWKAGACGCGGGEVGRIRAILRSREGEETGRNRINHGRH